MLFPPTHILVFGAGKSATVLIDYLKRETRRRLWELTVADADLETVIQKLGTEIHTHAIQLDITDSEKRRKLIAAADVVISLMPPALHYHVALDCLSLGKHLLTASYVDDKIKALQQEIAEKGLLFLCEMGLDPGIDHMSAMQLIHSIKAKGGKIRSFLSHCGGLVAPESDTNPWHYKISWNPRNVVLAGKAGAIFLKNGEEKSLSYEHLFRESGKVSIPDLGTLAYYANRDSLSYIPKYDLQDCSTFIRTTLRYPDFCKGWAAIVDLKLTDEIETYDTDNMRMCDFIQLHIQRHQLPVTADRLSSDSQIHQMLVSLGLNAELPIKKGICTAADILQWRMESSWILEPHDKDMIVMLHEIEYELNGKHKSVKSSLVVKGEDHLRTAMAKTVGLPLGIAAVLLAEKSLHERGLHIPIISSIYTPVLSLLEKEGIVFHEVED
ncbi:saccharopine dehydrogenase C-terminal domain-containing protein [Sediminibacterium sp. KACHI17]|uniref:Saccharopine dehydrogenase C-terminal domain-containing protein n=1 Tax=Sediminibacterium sp. KACHI17 TaxID=1751071 RepID=A0AAT9GG38_9BACT